MNLLPKSISNFSKEEYWNKFFTKRGNQSFEWYGEYPHLCGLLHKYMKPNDKLLNIGCGNSQLSVDLYDVGFHNNVNIDISNIAIKQMNDKHVPSRKNLQFKTMDMLQMTFDNEEFSVVLDKGTLDALMSEDTEEVNRKAEKLFSEIKRVLRPCGRYICISLLQDFILKKLLNWFINEGWMIRIHRIPEIEREPDQLNSSFVFPTFFVICTKTKVPTMKSIIELDMNSNLDRVESGDEVFKTIKSVQEYALYIHYIQNKRFVDDDINIDLYDSKNLNPRYTFYIIDQKSYAPVKFAVFIVPQGREMEWMFASTAGRKQLIENAGCERLVIVHLNRNHLYTDLDEVKRELSSKVMEFAPSDFKKNVKVPFMSIGSNIGQRTLCYSGKSETSGDYIIEDVQGEGEQMFRRLVFLSNQYVIQSEAKLVKEIVKKNKKKKNHIKWNIDFNYLSCQHHIYMFAGLSFLNLENTENINSLMVGLGGGLLPMFMKKHIKKISIDVVELDEDVMKIANKWFGLELSEKLKVHIADGIEFIANSAQKGEKYEVVMLDVDNKDISAGISCPPISFVQEPFLKKIIQLISPNGILILNLACRDQQIKNTIFSNLSSVFSVIFAKSVADEVNQIIYALPNQTETENNLSAHAKKNLLKLTEQLKSSMKEDFIDIKEFFKGLTIVK